MLYKCVFWSWTDVDSNLFSPITGRLTVFTFLPSLRYLSDGNCGSVSSFLTVMSYPVQPILAAAAASISLNQLCSRHERTRTKWLFNARSFQFKCSRVNLMSHFSLKAKENKMINCTKPYKNTFIYKCFMSTIFPYYTNKNVLK